MVFQKNLPAAWPADNVVAKSDSGLPEDIHVALKVAALHDYPIPSTGFRSAAIGHRL